MSRPEGLLRIGELARRAGVGRGTIQHYLREGLLPEPVKTGRNMGYYDPACVDRIRMIQRLRETRYLPLAEIRRLIAADGGEGGMAPVILGAQRAALESLTEQTTTTAPLSPEEACEALDLPPALLDALRTLHLVDARGEPGEETIEGPDLEVLAAIAHLKKLGFTEEAGFRAADLAAYREALAGLVRTEVETFLRVVSVGKRAADPVKLARTAVHAATLLIVALRKKLIADLIALQGLAPESPRRRGTARRRKGRP